MVFLFSCPYGDEIMSFLGGGGGSAKMPVITPTPPAPKPIDTAQPVEAMEKARKRRASQNTTLLTRGLMGEPNTQAPGAKTLLGQ